ncbi:MAG: Nramp family divalent metal transporter [Planctomycetaceae bacterium]
MSITPANDDASGKPAEEQAWRPRTCLPDWGDAELPLPRPLGLKNLAGFIGPGIVMCGIQLAGGEWLLGAEITARYGGSLMWIAAIAILGQVFYNIECGRYTLYCGEPVFTGFMRARPGPRFWIGIFVLLSLGAFIPALSTTAATVIAALYLDRPPGPDDKVLVNTLGYLLLGGVTLPILVGGKIYNMMQVVMTTKIVIVLGFCMLIGVTMVSAENWRNVFGGFLKIGNVPVVSGEDTNGNGQLDAGEDFDRDGHLDGIEPYRLDLYGAVVQPAPEDDLDGDGYHDNNGTGFEDVDGDGRWDGENVDNVITALFGDNEMPLIFLAQIALLGAFAGFAGGGGLSNSAYSNYVRDKGWGVGGQVGAIPSAVGGREISLSHVGKVFPLTAENMVRWKAWWKYIITDQLLIWAPGCIMGMALPALLSIQFAPHSEMFGDPARPDYTQAIMTADGMRHAPGLSAGLQETLWVATLIVGLLVLLPSQMSIVEHVCRHWTDILWSGSRKVRDTMQPHEVRKIYYTILVLYVTWTFVGAYLFQTYGKPKLMVLVVANLSNIALGFTAFFILRNNLVYLPRQLRPRWINRIGICFCGFFYLGIALLVFVQKQVPMLQEFLGLTGQ